MKSFSIILIGALISFILLFAGSGTQVVGETPCVDGKSRINLEGIMCEDVQNTWFGFNEWFMALSLLPLIIPICLFLVLDAKRSKNEK